jgi:DNA-binding MarR family transcriptional regulator
MDHLKLEHQLCFPLYALSRQVTNMYRPLLEALDLTYPQYLVMMLLWEHEKLSVKTIGNLLWLDSGTLTPLLKRLEQKGFLKRERDQQDERSVQISITSTGTALKALAEKIPVTLIENLSISETEGLQLIKQLHTILQNSIKNNNQ